MQDGVLPAGCILGLRLAARHIFHCSLNTLRRVLPPANETSYDLEQVMSYLADQQRSALQLDNSAVLLQVVVIDDFQLVRTQAPAFLPNNTRATALVNDMFFELGRWMMSGMPATNIACCASVGGHLCTSVCTSSIVKIELKASMSAENRSGAAGVQGLKSMLEGWYSSAPGLSFRSVGLFGLSGFRRMTTTVKLLTDEQVLSVMKADIISQHRLEPEAVDAFLRHPVIRAQIAMLVGVPNFMLMALDALLPQLSILPVTEEEVRSALYSLHWLDTPACHLTIAEVTHSSHGWQCSPQNVMWCTTVLTESVHSWCICRQIAGNVM